MAQKKHKAITTHLRSEAEKGPFSGSFSMKDGLNAEPTNRSGQTGIVHVSIATRGGLSMNDGLNLEPTSRGGQMASCMVPLQPVEASR